MLDKLPKVRLEDFFSYADLYWILQQVRDEAKNHPQAWTKCFSLLQKIYSIFPDTLERRATLSRHPIKLWSCKEKLSSKDNTSRISLERQLSDLMSWVADKTPSILVENISENLDFTSGAETLVLMKDGYVYKFSPTNHDGKMGFAIHGLTQINMPSYSGVRVLIEHATPEQYVQRMETVNRLKSCIPCQIEGITKDNVLITKEIEREPLKDFCERENISLSVKKNEWADSIGGVWLKNEDPSYAPAQSQLLIWDQETSSFLMLADARDCNMFVDQNGNVLANDLMPYSVAPMDLEQHPDLAEKAKAVVSLQQQREPSFILPEKYAGVLEKFPSPSLEGEALLAGGFVRRY
ncbi:MAG: hypothetical protein V1746_07360 [bacterium]